MLATLYRQKDVAKSGFFQSESNELIEKILRYIYTVIKLILIVALDLEASFCQFKRADDEGLRDASGKATNKHISHPMLFLYVITSQ